MMLRPSRAARSSSVSAASPRASSRLARQALRRPTCSVSTAGSITWIAPSPAESGDGSVSV